MTFDKEAFSRELQLFRAGCLENLEKGRGLLEQFDGGNLRGVVEKPFLLKMVLEKYLDLIDERLLPALLLDEGSSEKESAGGQREPLKQLHAPRKEVKALPKPVAGVAKPLLAEAPPPKLQTTRMSVTTTPPPSMKSDAELLGHGHQGKAKEKHAGRRVIPRYTRRLPLHYCVLGRDTTMQKAFSRDVGAMGLFIMANRPEKVGNSLEIEIDMPETGIIKIQAMVAWTKWVPQNLRAVDYSGFGVKITTAPEHWYTYFMKLENDPA